MKIAQRLLFVLLFLCGSAPLRAQLPLGPQFRINPDPTPDLMSPRVAIDASGDFVVLWYGFGGSSGGILHARRFKADGSPATGDIRVADQIVSTNENLGLAIRGDGSFLAVCRTRGVAARMGSTAGGSRPPERPWERCCRSFPPLPRATGASPWPRTGAS